MNPIIFAVVVVVPILAVMILPGLARRKQLCPACGAKLPALRMPKKWRQFLWGGWTCTTCGSEIDHQGRLLFGHE